MRIWRWIKRTVDLLISACAIIFLLPFWILLGLCIYLEDPGKIFFKQQRLGKNGKLFTIYKFRSMYINNIPPMELGAIKHDHSLVTRVGYFIRRFKLDETPQFLNVLLGNMSLIGPRPCLPERLSTMTLIQKKRLDFLPGLSGWAEVNGNVDLTWDEQIILDLWYVKNWTFFLDIKIIFLTLKVVLFGSEKNETALNDAKDLFVELNASQSS